MGASRAFVLLGSDIIRSLQQPLTLLLYRIQRKEVASAIVAATTFSGLPLDFEVPPGRGSSVAVMLTMHQGQSASDPLHSVLSSTPC